MPHIHTQPGEHDGTSSAYIVLEGGAEPRLWLHMHKKLGIWLQFGGHIELNETPWQAMVHELTEESGYELRQVQLLQPPVRIEHLTGAKSHPVVVSESTHVFPAGEVLHNHTDRAYAFVTSQQPALQPGEGESKTMKAVTAAEIESLPAGQITESTREVALFILRRVLPTYDRVDPSIYDL